MATESGAKDAHGNLLGWLEANQNLLGICVGERKGSVNGS